MHFNIKLEEIIMDHTKCTPNTVNVSSTGKTLHGRWEVSLAVAGRPVAVCTMLGSLDSKSTGLYNTWCMKKKVGVSTPNIWKMIRTF